MMTLSSFSFSTGLHIGETLAIAMNDINFNENYVYEQICFKRK